MNRIKLFSVILFGTLALCGNAQDAIVKDSSVYSGVSEIVATQQVVLRPGFHAVSGSNVRVYIGSYPVNNYNDPAVTEINPFNSSVNTGQNYIHTIALLEKTTDENTLDDKLRIETIGYFDGLGRPVQNVTVQGSPGRKDIVQPFVYDEFGREIKKYLPYMGNNTNGSFVSGATSACEGYYNTDKAWRVKDGRPYDSTHFESSPLNRVLGETGSGGSWKVHASSITYSTNGAAVEGWTVTGNLLATGFSHNSSMYAANQLYVTEFIDENGTTGVKTREYKDKLGQVVRKETYNTEISGWQRTAYVYDDFGLLRCVVPPLATGTGETGLCYYYLYDGRKRMIEKQLPGAGPVYMVYDKRDRLVMTKDAMNDWMATIYENLNRPVMTCIVPSASGTSRSTLQTAFGNFTGNAVCSGTGSNFGYTTTNIFPAVYTFSENNVQTVTFYDNYSFLQAPDFSLEASNYTYGGAYLTNDPATSSTKLKGAVTGTLTRVIDNAISNGDNLLLSVSYYDDYGRAIRVISDNHHGGKDKVYVAYNFVGNPEVTITTHNIDGAGEDVKMTSTYKYDHQGRLLTEKFKLNSDTEITLAANEYGDLGELASKYLHGTSTSEKYNQKTDYKYNIKGWLTNINEVNNLGKKLFGLTLHYADGTNGFYNGNIWKSDWQNNGTDPKRYTFEYDWASRLKTANYADGTGFTSNSGAFNTQYTYDKNGNLKTLKRYKAGDFIDDLAYTYPTGSNQLQSVSDNGTTGVKDLGYKSGARNYSYDGNGNMIEDHNGVDFGYNFLNLPEQVTNINQYIRFAYTATGEKLQKTVDVTTTGDKVVDYIGPFLYEDNDLKVIFTSAGRIVKNVDGSTVLWKYEYNLTDHLGNVRAVFAAHSNGIPELMQHTDYYPFGMVMNQQEMFKLEEVKNRYLYNGKELQDDNIGISLDWYDYGARFYDPELGRWHSVDPMADEREWLSPYNFVQNNPLNRIDPDGALDDWVERDNQIVWDENVTSADDKDLQKGDKYLGKEGYGINEQTGQTVHYQADGTMREFSQTLSGVTLTPNYAYSTQNPSISTHNQTGYIWNERDLAVWNKLNNHNSSIGTALRGQVSSGNYDILSATNYWNTYGQTSGSLMLFQNYFDMMNVVTSYPGTKLNSYRGFNLKPTLSTPKTPTLNGNWNSTKPTFNEFRSANKGAFTGYKGRGTNTKAAWETYKHLYGN